MAATAQQLLDALNDAILAVLTGEPVQRRTIGSVDITYFSLQQLYALRGKLQAEAGATASTNPNGPGRNYASF